MSVTEKINSSITINHLSHCYEEREVLKKINLIIQRGEILGMLGPSGAGKTTLIKILTGQLEQTSGEALIFGEDSRHLSKDIYTQMGMVLDNSGLYERLTCYDNLELFRQIYGIPKGRIKDVLNAVGLLDAEKRPVMKLSKGMKGRLVLARAIMHEPKLLFLDEPTSGLDPATAAEIHKLILKQRERGATILLTTHNMEEAAKICNHVALLHEGNIVEYGEPEEICRKHNNQNRISILLKDGSRLSLNNDRTAAEELKNYMEAEKVETIHSTEPNLETVFMELTGRSFE